MCNIVKYGERESNAIELIRQGIWPEGNPGMYWTGMNSDLASSYDYADPDLVTIGEQGKLFNDTMKLTNLACLPCSSLVDIKDMQIPRHCSWNASKAFKAHIIDFIAIGYATPRETPEENVFHKHAWGIKDNTIIELTEPGVIYNADTKYFGIILTLEQCHAFVAKCETSIPGEGNLRTIKGGPVIF